MKTLLTAVLSIMLVAGAFALVFASDGGMDDPHPMYGMMGGQMEKEASGEVQKGQAAHGGYGMMGYGGHMMGQGCGEHMMGGMMGGPGGHMIGSGCGEHMMEGMMGYGTEEEYRKYLDETVDLRRALHNKKFEISEALRNPETTRKTLLQLRKEMLEIKVKIYEKAIKSN